MANSESEDFESADEEVMKPREHQDQYQQKQKTASSDREEMSPPLTSSQESADLPSGTVPPHTTVVPNPDSLGAKPKMPLKSKVKSHSRHRSHKDSEGPGAPNIDGGQKKRASSGKLGVKIISSTILPSEISALDSEEFQGKSKISWSGNILNDNSKNKDSHDSIQPLLDKLSSLDVVDAPDEVTSSADEKSTSGWGSWGQWGMSTIMSGASSVSSHVTQGLSTVSSVIESGLGAVDPQEMARISVESDKSGPKTGQTTTAEQAPSSFNVMGNVLKFVESTGEMIVTSGLNTLETLGKKTMDVLQEGDPGLKKKRALFSREPDKPTLSQVLKEARGRAEVEDKERAEAKQVARARFETLFDDYRGMVHLEALEMLSNTCQMKLEAKLIALSGTPLVEFQRKLIQVKEQCDIPDDDDDDEDEDRGSIEILERDLTAAMRGLMVPVPHTKLIRVSEDTDTWLATMRCIQDDDAQTENDDWVDEEDMAEDSDPQNGLRDIHQQAIRALARFTAAVAEHFHKTAELLLLKEEHNSQIESQCVVMMTSVLCSRVSSVAARFSELLSASANLVDSAQVDHNDVNLLITNVFLEASNSSSYIQDASLLLIPVLQLGAVQ